MKNRILRRQQLPEVTDLQWRALVQLSQNIVVGPFGNPSELMPQAIAQRLRIDNRDLALRVMYAFAQSGVGDLRFYVYHCVEVAVGLVDLGDVGMPNYECPECELFAPATELKFEFVVLIPGPFGVVE